MNKLFSFLFPPSSSNGEPNFTFSDVKPDTSSQLYKSLFSSILLGVLPIFCFKIIPTSPRSLKVLLSFASGALLGDVFLHLIPHALSSSLNSHSHSHSFSHTHEHSNSNNIVSNFGYQLICGFFIFWVIEKTFLEFGGENNHKHDHNHSHDHNRECSKLVVSSKKKNSVAILSIIADYTHNFTDGLAIVAAFMISDRMGFLQSCAIFFHEIPHEIGDFAILIENGVSIKNAVFIQFLTALGCVFGTLIGYWAGNNQAIGYDWIIPFTSGGFIYISCVQVLPVLNEKKFGNKQSILHVIGFLAGVGLMHMIGEIEHWDHDH